MNGAGQKSKLIKLEAFINKKLAQGNNVTRNQSKKNPQVISLIEDQEVKLETYPETSQYSTWKTSKYCEPFLLFSPADMDYYESSIVHNLESLLKNPDKGQIIRFIYHNLRFYKIQNVSNLYQLDDDLLLWRKTIPGLLDLVYRGMPQITGRVRLLNQHQNEQVELTRKQILIILASMFFGIMPRQYHQSGQTTFGELMCFRSKAGQSNNSKKVQKLKCILSYFTDMISNSDVLQEPVRIRRCCSPFSQQIDSLKGVRMRSVQVQRLSEGSIEANYCLGVMVDFANKHLGGGVLGNGCVQEEIMFSIFPQLIVTKLITAELDQNQAVIVQGARRFSYYSGYENTFKYTGSCFDDQREYPFDSSVIVAIDAYEFKPEKELTFRKLDQYSKPGLKRQLLKALTGFKGASLYAEPSMSIVTGRWGCGVFQGDEDVKFVIQWIACSLAQRNMVYITSDNTKIIQYKCLIRQFKVEKTDYLIHLLQDYFLYSKKWTRIGKPGLLDYIKTVVL